MTTAALVWVLIGFVLALRFGPFGKRTIVVSWLPPFGTGMIGPLAGVLVTMLLWGIFWPAYVVVLLAERARAGRQ